MSEDNMSTTCTVSSEVSLTSPTLTGGYASAQGTVTVKPREVKGGVFAPADIALIKKALIYYVNSPHGESSAAVQEEKQIVNLLHRLNNRI